MSHSNPFNQVSAKIRTELLLKGGFSSFGMKKGGNGRKQPFFGFYLEKVKFGHENGAVHPTNWNDFLLDY